MTSRRSPHPFSALLALGLALLASCSTLPQPGSDSNVTLTGAPEAKAIVEASADQAGDPWRRNLSVDLDFQGQWTAIAKRVQPELTDPLYRQSSEESYRPATQSVHQRHQGKAGIKEVHRSPGEILVTYNGKEETAELQKAASALVADAYRLFVFRSSWLAAKGTDFKVIDRRPLGDESCWLIQAMVEPGFGTSKRDHVIVWVGETTKRTHRVQLTLFGLESTAMADVDVTFDEFQSGDLGTEWPRHYVEFVQRPFKAKAHEWVLEGIQVRRAR